MGQMNYFLCFGIKQAEGISISINLWVKSFHCILASGGLRLFEGQGRKNKTGTFCTTWGPTSVQKHLQCTLVFSNVSLV